MHGPFHHVTQNEKDMCPTCHEQDERIIQAPAFTNGDLVGKIGGRYGGPGRVVSVSDDLGAGHRLYGVAMKVEGGYGEFVHVFPATVLRKR